MARWIRLALIVGVAVAGGAVARDHWTALDASAWQRHVSPGLLSHAHRSLERRCTACHTPTKSAEDVKCIGCHASNTTLLQRQPTAFHATIGTCRACHIEHLGAGVRPTRMDHVILAQLGLDAARRNIDDPSNRRLLSWVRQHDDVWPTDRPHPRVTAAEAALECATCHRTKDKHQTLFGPDCASCHATRAWTIPEFKHPSPNSVDCVQCHQAPPSHYMGHFHMVSRSVARQPHARVEQCFACHQTTSWNDIKQVGWYKHH